MKKKILLVLASICFTFLICEIILHLIIQKSQKSYGTIFNIELPPMEIFQEQISIRQEKFEDNQTLNKYKDHPFDSLEIKGKRITQSDIWGVMRLDELLGYNVKENSSSTNSWWQSNNIGARAISSTDFYKIEDYERILFFGDSFTQGTSVPQGETFISFINKKGKNIEAINFGVNGYSIGQSYLRYTTSKDKLEYDHVVLVVVPDCNLAREINVSRYIGFNWDGFNDLILVPRFILENGQLFQISNPYDLNKLFDYHPDILKQKIVDHLKKYDAFYFGYWYENNSIFDGSLIFKLSKYLKYKSDIANLKNNLLNIDGEAMSVTKAIIRIMANQVESTGARFSLIILPTNEDIYRYLEYDSYKESWEDMHSYLCKDLDYCYGFMENLIEDEDLIDSGYDGTHYGPITNKIIADIILRKVIKNR